MKRFIWLVIVALLSLTLSSCVNQGLQAGSDTPTAVPGGTVPPAESQSKSDAGGGTKSGGYTAELDLPTACADWAKSWAESTYGEYGINDINAKYLSGNVLTDLSDSFEIYAMICSVSFSSEKTIPDIPQDSNGGCSLKVLCTAAVENSDRTASLVGFLGPGQFDEQYCMPNVCELVSKDPRYSSRLKSLPVPSFPKEFQKIDLYKVLGSHFCICARTLPDGTAAALYADMIENSELENISVMLFDSKTKEVLKYVNIGEYENASSESVFQGKIVFKVLKNASSTDEEVVTVDSKGNVTREECTLEKNNIRYSPDGSKYAYSNKNNLYVADSDGSNPKLLITGIYSEGQDWKCYYPYEWLDNSKIVYGIGGYEWSSGCGVYDLTNGKDTFLQQVSYDAPIALINSSLFTSPMTLDVPFDPSIVDLNDTVYPARKIFENRDFININMQQSAISPDGSKIALLEYLDDTSSLSDYHYKLYICSTDDGSILKEYEFQTGSGNIQYIDYYDESHISLYGARSAYSGDCLYIVNIS